MIIKYDYNIIIKYDKSNISDLAQGSAQYWEKILVIAVISNISHLVVEVIMLNPPTLEHC